MNIVSGILFLAADCFAIASLTIQRWIESDRGSYCIPMVNTRKENVKI